MTVPEMKPGIDMRINSEYFKYKDKEINNLEETNEESIEEIDKEIEEEKNEEIDIE